MYTFDKAEYGKLHVSIGITIDGHIIIVVLIS